MFEVDVKNVTEEEKKEYSSGVLIAIFIHLLCNKHKRRVKYFLIFIILGVAGGQKHPKLS